MAKAGGRSILSSIFYIIMSVMAMNFLALCIYLIALNQLGFCSLDDYKDIVRVLVGTRKYVLSREQIVEYNKLREEHAAIEKDLGRAEGSISTRQESAAALNDMQKLLEERIAALRELRTDHEQKLTELRANIETLKAEYVRERNNLQEWKAQNTEADQSESYKQMTKTLRAMEPDIIANLFTGNMKRPGGAEENARLIRKYLTPDITAEVMATVDTNDMRQIVPLIENKYAGMSPELIVKAWTTPNTADYKTPDQMATYLRNMTVSQAFTIFSMMDPKIRAELARLLRLPAP